MPRYNPLKPTKPARPPRPEPLPKGTIPTPEPVSHTPTLSENEACDGLELRFPTKPDEATLKAFHATQDLPAEHRWHWHRKLKFWYARRNPVTRTFAAQVLTGNVSVPQPTPPPAPDANVVKVNFEEAGSPLNPLHRPLPAWRARLLNRN